MSVSDPISDMLTRIRNAVMAEHSTVALPNSKMKAAIAQILKDEGYISGYEIVDDSKHPPQKILPIPLKKGGEQREGRAFFTGKEADMSRIGRLPVIIPPHVDVNIDGALIKVKGPKGTLEYSFPNSMSLS